MFLLDRFICYMINKTARNWVAFCTKFDNIFDGLKSFFLYVMSLLSLVTIEAEVTIELNACHFHRSLSDFSSSYSVCLFKKKTPVRVTHRRALPRLAAQS